MDGLVVDMANHREAVHNAVLFPAVRKAKSVSHLMYSNLGSPVIQAIRENRFLILVQAVR
jgi:hypothetical protein